MNEEIARILQMLEAGKISAEEAERLIRAVNEGGAPGSRAPHGGPGAEGAHEGAHFEPFHNLKQLFRWLSEAQMRGMRRQIRWYWWRRYRCDRWEARQRGQRADTMSATDRVRFVLLERVQVDNRDPRPTESLTELLSGDSAGWERSAQTAWEVLRLALEDEFGIQIDATELKAVPTVQALVEYVEARVPPKPQGAPEAAAPEPPAPPAPPQGRAPRPPKPAVEEPQASEAV